MTVKSRCSVSSTINEQLSVKRKECSWDLVIQRLVSIQWDIDFWKSAISCLLFQFHLQCSTELTCNPAILYTSTYHSIVNPRDSLTTINYINSALPLRGTFLNLQTYIQYIVEKSRQFASSVIYRKGSRQKILLRTLQLFCTIAVYIHYSAFSSHLFFNFPYQFKVKDIPNIASGSLMVISSEALLKNYSANIRY